MKKFLVFLCCGIILLSLAACGSSQSDGKQPLETPLSSVGYLDSAKYDERPVSIYDTVELNPGEKLAILDVSGSRILINIYRNYLPEDRNFSEEGYNAITEKIIEFDFKTGKIVDTLPIFKGYCSNAIYLEDNSIVCTILSPGFLSHYKIVKVYDNTVKEITSGSCYANGFDDPQLVKLDHLSFAYSYSNVDISSDDFGVNIVSEHGDITQQVYLIDDGKTEHLRATLTGDNSRYMYYAAIDGKGAIIIGDRNDILYQFELPSTERIYDFCLLGEFALFSLEDVSNDGSIGKLAVKNMNGKTIAEKSNDSLFRIKSNGINTALSIDLRYQIHAVQFINGNITISKMDLPRESILFYNLDENSFLLHYDYNSDPKNLGVFLLEFK